MKIGFGRNDITPRIGVELCGFGPYRCRHSVAIRDRLWARAMAVEQGTQRVLLVSCDLIGTSLAMTRRVRRIVSESTGVASDAIMVHCTHTHSGPATGSYTGWGEPDLPYLETLPQRIARACSMAVERLEEATLAHAEVPCEGIGRNREYDLPSPLPEEALRDGWRPRRPELTDTTCHVFRVESAGRVAGFLSYFGCHPVVCCEATRQIHGDFCGVATNQIESENPGAVGLFLQGAQGDVNTCVAHQPETEALRSLDIIAARYASSVRAGLRAAQPVAVDTVRSCRREVTFSRKPWGLDKIRTLLAEKEALVHAPDAIDGAGKAGDPNIRMETVYLVALRHLVAEAEAGRPLSPATELQGLRLGPVALLGSPLEVFQAIRNDVKARAKCPIPLVMGFCNDSIGYAPDRAAASRGGYAADSVPSICRALPFANAHDELAAALLELDASLS